MSAELLPESDIAFLRDRGFEFSAQLDGGMICLIISNWKLPAGYALGEVELLLRLPTGYPDIAPDMWWFSPAVTMLSGQPIPATEVVEPYFGKSWQRWSRHLDAGQWQSGVDGLESFVALIRSEIDRQLPVAA